MSARADWSERLFRSCPRKYVIVFANRSTKPAPQGLQIGIVETIAGIRQSMVTTNGVSAHAGTIPMDTRLGFRYIVASTEGVITASFDIYV